MPLKIRNEAGDQRAETRTEAVKLALENEPRHIDATVPLRQRLRSLQDRVLARPATGAEADKAFYDELGGTP